MMTEKEVAEFLEAAIQSLENEMGFDGPYTDSIKTFKDAGILTKSTGLVIPFEDGSVFQITIVNSTAMQRKSDQEEGRKDV